MAVSEAFGRSSRGQSQLVKEPTQHPSPAHSIYNPTVISSAFVKSNRFAGSLGNR